MKTAIYFFYLLKLIIIKNELISVIEINRHGARTPKKFASETRKFFFDTKEMQLTINGYRQQQILGKFVKSKYIKQSHFLKKNFDSNEFKMISSPTQRTIFSAAGFLSGIYPEYIIKMNYLGNVSMVNNDTIPVSENIMSIHEIPIEVVDNKNDSLFHAHSCHLDGKKINKYLQKLNFPDIFNINDEEKKEAFIFLKSYLGLNNMIDLDVDKDFSDLAKYFNVYFYHINRKLRSGVNKNIINTVKKFYLNKWYSFRVVDNKYLRICASHFFTKILNNFKTSIRAYEEKKSYIKYTVYSGHDTILINLFTNLLKNNRLNELVFNALHDASSYRFLIPPFASNLFFELHKREETKKYHVKIIYNGKYISNGIKGINDEEIINNRIDYEKFVELLTHLIDEDYKRLDCSSEEKESSLES